MSILPAVIALATFMTSAPETKVLSVDSDDVEMNLAIARAREGLDGFVERAGMAGAREPSVKVKFEDSNGIEHLWVEPFIITDEGFEGYVANEPRTVRSVKFEEWVSFKREDITDWGYINEGVRVGYFTICVQLRRMPAGERVAYREAGFRCEP